MPKADPLAPLASAMADLLCGAVASVVREPINRTLRKRRLREQLLAQIPSDSQLAQVAQRMTKQHFELSTSDPESVMLVGALLDSAYADGALTLYLAARFAWGEDVASERVGTYVTLVLRKLLKSGQLASSESILTAASTFRNLVTNIVNETNLLKIQLSDLLPELSDGLVKYSDLSVRAVNLVAPLAIEWASFDGIRDSYLAAVRHVSGTVPTPRWEGSKRVPTESVYVPATFSKLRLDANDVDDEFPSEEGANSEARKYLAEIMDTSISTGTGSLTRDIEFLSMLKGTCWADSGHRRFVILGDPGGGKSTLIKYLQHTHAAEPEASPPVRRLLPFLVTLRDYWKRSSSHGDSITEFIHRRIVTDYGIEISREALELELLSGQVLVAFDGLDEILDIDARQKCGDRIESFCILYPMAHVLVTSRLRGYDAAALDSELFSTRFIDPYSASDVDLYLRKWISLEPGLSTPRRRALVTQLSGELGIIEERLKQNPLTLALLCNLAHEQDYESLPRTRAALYERCALMLYNKWDERRDLSRVSALDFLTEFLPTLCYVAYDALTSRDEYRDGYTESELVSLCVKYLFEESKVYEDASKARAFASSLVEYCAGRAWVLSTVDTDAQEGDLFGFTHRTFAEYFAARYLADKWETASEFADNLVADLASRGKSLLWEIALESKAASAHNAGSRVFGELIERVRVGEGNLDTQLLDFLVAEVGAVNIGQAVAGELFNLVLATWDDHGPRRLAAVTEARGTAGEELKEKVTSILTEWSRNDDLRARAKSVLDMLRREHASPHWERLHVELGF